MRDEQWKKRESPYVETALKSLQNQRTTSNYSLGLNALTPRGFEQLVEGLGDPAETDFLSKAILGWLAGPARNWLNEDNIGQCITLADYLFQTILDLLELRPEFSKWDVFDAVYEAELKPQKRNAQFTDAIDSALKRLAEYGVPFWTLKESLWPGLGSLAHINLLGYHHTQSHNGHSLEWVERARQVLGRANPVRHNRPNQLVLLQTKHGAPAYVITASVLNQREIYNKAMLRWKTGSGNPIHLQDDWCRGHGLTALDPRS
jgi:hypothetical protein